MSEEEATEPEIIDGPPPPGAQEVSRPAVSVGPEATRVAPFPSATRVGASTLQAVIGAIPLGTAPPPSATGGEDRALHYTLASIAGATAGGGLIGLFASGDLRGAFTGASAVGGVSSVVNGLRLNRRADPRRALGVSFTLGGVLAFGAGAVLAFTREDEE